MFADMPTGPALTDLILRRCRELGFAAAGVCRADPSENAAEIRRWLADGKHGDMAFLADTVETLLDPSRELAGVRSVVMVADLYHARPAEGEPSFSPPPAGPVPGRIARYAQGRDYHTHLKKRLHRLNDELRPMFPGHHFRTFVDTAPVLEREFAHRAGLGWIGKHTLTIHPRLGSSFFLGGTYTTLDLTPAPDQPTPRDHCGTCTRCIEACPTRAITPYSVDATRCISYLTIERQGPIDPAFHAAMGEWLYGCDVCQEVCPHNSPRGDPEGVANPHYAPERTSFDALSVLGWDESARRAAFRTTSMKRASLAMMQRNALIVLTNHILTHPDTPPVALERLRTIAADPTQDPLVTVTARQCLDRLSRPSAPRVPGS
jgi:epoxyqueuosine reductase